jgi:hypothetical protein
MSNMKMWFVGFSLILFQAEHLLGISAYHLGSITEWDDFERLFIRKFGERKMTASLHKELGAIKMDKKEKVKYFNQRFLNVLIKFPHDVAPAQSLAIEYYMTMLTPSIGMFVKRDNKNTLALNFDEAETIERELSSYEHHSHTKETKTIGKRPLLLTKPPEKEPKDIDNVVKLVKKFSNKVVDLKKNVGEGSSKPELFDRSLRDKIVCQNHLNHLIWILT